MLWTIDMITGKLTTLLCPLLSRDIKGRSLKNSSYIIIFSFTQRQRNEWRHVYRLLAPFCRSFLPLTCTWKTNQDASDNGACIFPHCGLNKQTRDDESWMDTKEDLYFLSFGIFISNPLLHSLMHYWNIQPLLCVYSCVQYTHLHLLERNEYRYCTHPTE